MTRSKLPRTRRSPDYTQGSGTAARVRSNVGAPHLGVSTGGGQPPRTRSGERPTSVATTRATPGAPGNDSPETPTFSASSPAVPVSSSVTARTPPTTAAAAAAAAAAAGDGNWRTARRYSTRSSSEDSVDMAVARPWEVMGNSSLPSLLVPNEEKQNHCEPAGRQPGTNDRYPEAPGGRTQSGFVPPSGDGATTTGSVTSSAKSSDSQRYKCFDALINMVSIGSYIADVGSDLFLVYLYYTGAHWWWLRLTLIFVLAPALVMTVFSLRWYIIDFRELSKKNEQVSKCRWMSRIMFLVLQLAPILRYIDTVIYGVRSVRHGHKPEESKHWYDQMLYEDTDSALLRLFECFMEAAPQLCLQLYIMITYGGASELYLVIAQWASTVTSLVSIAWALCSYHRSLRLSLPFKPKMTIPGVIFQFLWHFFTIGARIITLATFASCVKGWVFVLVGAHWCAMLIWILIQGTKFCETKWEEFFFDVVGAFVYIFCYFNLTEGHTRLRYLFYYTLVYSENTAMVLIWYLFTQTHDHWYKPYILVAALAGFPIGVCFQVIYYLCFHPNNYDGDKAKHIPLFRPLRVLAGEDNNDCGMEMSRFSDPGAQQPNGSSSAHLSMGNHGNRGYVDDSDSTDCIQPLMADVC